MLFGFSILGGSEQNGVGTYIIIIIEIRLYILTLQLKNKKRICVLHTGWGGHDQLIESNALSTGFDNLSSGGLGESEGSYGKLWSIKKSDVISDS